MIIIGEKEAANKTISVRQRGKGDIGSMSYDDFLKLIEKELFPPLD